MTMGEKGIWFSRLMPGERLLWERRAENARLIVGLGVVVAVTAQIHPLMSAPVAAFLVWAVRIRRERYALTDRRVLALQAPLLGPLEMRALERAGTTLMPGYAASNKSLMFTAAGGRRIRFNSQPADIRRWFIETYAKAGTEPFPATDQTVPT